MTMSTEEKNVQIVLDAFEALFNKRDYAAAERFWCPEKPTFSAHARKLSTDLQHYDRSVSARVASGE